MDIQTWLAKFKFDNPDNLLKNHSRHIGNKRCQIT